ncbi:MAG: hypothetical protein ACI9YT_002170 [Halobacteriales archaeon]|jgi:hypothetical protein
MQPRLGPSAVGLALLLVIAGCSAPIAGDGTMGTATDAASTETANAAETAETTEAARTTTNDPPPTATATGGPPDVAVEGGSLPVDPGVVFARVQDVAGTDASPPDAVRVVENRSALFGTANNVSAGGPAPLLEFYRLVGVRATGGGNESAFERMEGGVTTGFGTVRIYPGEEPSATAVEPVLAHEFAHYLEVADRRPTRLVRGVPEPATTDGRFVRRSVREGAAVWIETAYVNRYLPNGTTGIDRTERVYDLYPRGSLGRYGMAQYVFGYRYVRSRVDDPAALAAVYEDPPRTSEQVLHRVSPGAEPPAPLAVAIDDGGTPYAGVVADRLGEAFVRTALENGVATDRAAAAATGWGNDRLAFVRRDGDVHFVWVLRWDDAANATAFADAARELLDARGNRTDGGWIVDGTRTELRRPIANTTVLVAGPDGFVRGVSVTTDGTAVTITPPRDDATARVEPSRSTA